MITVSMFTGRQHRGAMRQYRAKKVENAFRRQLALWNGGTGMYQRRPTDIALTRVSHPLFKIPKKDRHLYAKEFPDFPM